MELNGSDFRMGSGQADSPATTAGGNRINQRLGMPATFSFARGFLWARLIFDSRELDPRVIRVLQRDIHACCAHVFEFALQMQPQARIAVVPH
jgi:hypothetical protein